MSPGRTIDLSEEPSSHVPVIDKGSLHRVLTTPQLYAIGYGDVGSSIYYALGVTTLYALGATPLALALAGIVFFCTVLTYAELAAAMPEAGGSCSFARHAFNDLVSFIAGWALLLDYVVTIAISAYTVGPYVSNFFPELRVIGYVPFALGIIGILLAINFVGIRHSTWVSLVLCVFNNITQLLIIGVAAVFIMQIHNPPVFLENLKQLFLHMQIGVEGASWSPTWPDFMKGVGMAMVAYIGIESISQLAGEARHPDKTVPRAMIMTMVTLFVFYFAISFVALSALSPQELSTTYLEDPIAGIVSALPVGVGFLRPWVGIVGGTILFIAANAGLIGASRLTFAMGEYFELPRMFYKLHPRFKTPYISLCVFAGIAAIIVLFAGRLKHMAELYNFGAMLSFGLAHLSLLGLRIKQPNLRRPFLAKGNFRVGPWILPITAIIGLLGTTAVWIDVIITKPAGRNFGFAWLAIGLVLYVWYRRKQELSPSARLEIEKLTVPDYKEVSVKKILVPYKDTSVASETIQFAARIAKAHDAEVTALHVIEIPHALPLDTFFPEKLALADSVVEQAQAIGRESDVPIDAMVRQGRFAGEAIVELAKEGQYDLLIVNGKQRFIAAPGRATFGPTVDYVLKSAPCRVWLFTGKA